MTYIHRLFQAATVVPVMLTLTVGCVLLTRSAHAEGAISAKAADAKPAKPMLSLRAGEAPENLNVLRETLGKVPGIKFNADGIKFSDIRRDGALFTSFFPVEITDLARTDIGAIAKAMASANTLEREKHPPAVYLVIRYRPGSANDKQLRAALADVKGVRADQSWAGDVNLWLNVDGSGQGRLAEITRALHAAGIKIRDPITDITD